MALTQTNAVSVIASEGDAKAAYDLDYSTSVEDKRQWYFAYGNG